MKAVEYTTYGPPEVLKLKEVSIPEPSVNEVLIKVKATSVTSTEAIFRSGQQVMARLYTGLIKPRTRRLGEELAGEVIQVGGHVSRFKVRDRVFGTAGTVFSANAEYLCLSEDEVITHMPDNMTFEEAASSCDGFLTALPFLRDYGDIKKNDHVLILGASGSIGSSAVQISQYYGAHATAVCSGRNESLVRDLGADDVIDYTHADFTQTDQCYDIIFDAVGKFNYDQCKHLLKEDGKFLEVAMNANILFNSMITSVKGQRKAIFAATGLRPPAERLKDLELLKEMLEGGIIKPVIDSIYALDEIVDAHRYVEKGHKRGNVAIAVA